LVQPVVALRRGGRRSSSARRLTHAPGRRFFDGVAGSAAGLCWTGHDLRRSARLGAHRRTRGRTRRCRHRTSTRQDTARGACDSSSLSVWPAGRGAYRPPAGRRYSVPDLVLSDLPACGRGRRPTGECGPDAPDAGTVGGGSRTARVLHRSARVLSGRTCRAGAGRRCGAAARGDAEHRWYADPGQVFACSGRPRVGGARCQSVRCRGLGRAGPLVGQGAVRVRGRPGRLRREQGEPAMSGVAAIDCGTNSIRLLIADVVHIDGDEVQVVDADRRMEIVRLGQDVDKTGAFAPEALERTFGALREYAETIRAYGIPLGPDGVRMVATSATRDARNRQVFVDGVREILGVEPEVVTGLDEAELSFVGATAELEAEADEGGEGHPSPFLVVDIGGGSTEFVLGHGPETNELIRASLSVDVGCVRMAERHLHDDPPTEEQIAAATADIDAMLDEVEKTVPLREAGSVVCVAGTATTVAGMALDLPEYNAERIHGTVVGVADLDRISAELLKATAMERAEIGV